MAYLAGKHLKRGGGREILVKALLWLEVVPERRKSSGGKKTKQRLTMKEKSGGRPAFAIGIEPWERIKGGEKADIEENMAARRKSRRIRRP